MKGATILAAVLIGLAGAALGHAQTALRPKPEWSRAPSGPPSFFVTSVGMGKGADLGGLAGADRHCQVLAEAVGLGARTWRAYLSTQATPAMPAVNARDRIGRGPWFNVAGGRVAADLAELHGDTLEAARAGNLISKATALDERGRMIAGEGETPKYHDILTGSRTDGRAYADDGTDRTCSNWTYGGDAGSAQIGHSDRNSKSASISWNSAHPTLGCSPAKLAGSGGGGLFYCFAADDPR